MVDDTSNEGQAFENVARLDKFVRLAYRPRDDRERQIRLKRFLHLHIPPEIHYAFAMLPTQRLPSTPLYCLLEGFRTDLLFAAKGNDRVNRTWPILTGSVLELHAARVARTVAELCSELVIRHSAESVTSEQRRFLLHAGARMGVALQYVNIARDIAVDARLCRGNIPTTWLAEVGPKPNAIIANPHDWKLGALRDRLLDEADCIYKEARPAIEALPSKARAPLHAVVESYMEIGRTLQRIVHLRK